MNVDTGEIKYGIEEELKAEGFTENLTEEEAQHLMGVPPAERKEELTRFREQRIKELEQDVAAKEAALAKQNEINYIASQLEPKKRDGSFTKRKKRDNKNKRKMVKDSRKKNRKRK